MGFSSDQIYVIEIEASAISKDVVKIALFVCDLIQMCTIDLCSVLDTTADTYS